MKIQVKDLKPNPYRRIREYPIDTEKVESLKSSINDTTFWDNLLARESGNGFEIAYGHHRLIALKELKVKEIDIPVRDLDNGMMIKIMANENRDSYRANRAVTVETVKVAREWLREQMAGEWEMVSKSIHHLFPNKASFAQSKAQGVGWKTIQKFLGGDWKDWEIQEALEQMTEKDDFDPKAMDSFETMGTARAAKDAMKRYKIPKERQKAVAKTLSKKKVAKHHIDQTVAEIAKAEGYTGEPKANLPALPPKLDERIENIIKDVGSLSDNLSRVKGYLSYIENKRVFVTLKTYAKILQDNLAEILQEMEN